MRINLKQRETYFSKKGYLIGIILLLLLFISVGFSYLQTTLGIDGDVSFPYTPKPLYTILTQDVVVYNDNTNSRYVTSLSGINFSVAPSDTNGKGLYLLSSTAGDNYPIYYYRGEVENNNVLFGGFCWKIVRTTETGGTKLIYNGVPNYNNKDGMCANTGTASQLSATSKFNPNSTSLASLGYMYGTNYSYTSWQNAKFIYGSDVSYANGEYTLTDVTTTDELFQYNSQKHYTCKTNATKCSTVYYIYSLYNSDSRSGIEDKNIFAIELTDGKMLEDIISDSFTNEHDSIVKETLDNWFKENLTNEVDSNKKDYQDYLEDAVWCNNRRIYSGGYRKNSGITTSSGRTELWPYGASQKFPSKLSSVLKDSIACPDQNDRFTLKASRTSTPNPNGNQSLDYPVGLLTAYEAIVAGQGNPGYSKKSFLYTGETYYLMTPYFAANFGIYSNVMVVSKNGPLSNDYLHYNRGIRPSISLKNDVMIIFGTGTSKNPYIVGK